MVKHDLVCLKCAQPLSLSQDNVGKAQQCAKCSTIHDVYVFLAYFARVQEVVHAQSIVLDDQSSCYNHPSKQAETVCDICGRFLCTLCAAEVDDQQVCLDCLTSLQDSGKVRRLEKRRVLYDSLALYLAFVPLLMWFITLVTAPAVLFIVIKHWHRGSSSLVSRTRIRYVIAFIAALLEVIAWFLFFVWGF